MKDIVENSAHIYKLVELCVACGVRYAVVCPGSRCAPLLVGFGRHSLIETISVTDERVAGFVALGLSQQSGTPVVLVCTSGTAGLNFSPAVAEAFYQNVPLIVLTADRPLELIDQWDGQTIRQTDMYTNFVEKSITYTKENFALAESIFQCRGPVHLNIPISEPFYPSYVDEVLVDKIEVKRKEKVVWVDDVVMDEFADILVGSSGVLILAGQLEPCSELCDVLGMVDIPVAADITSNLQSLPGCFRVEDIKSVPEVLVTVGRSIISKRTRLFLRENKPMVHWHIGRGLVGDPFFSLSRIVDVEPELFFAEVVKRNIKCRGCELVHSAIDVDDSVFDSYGVVGTILMSLPAGSILHLGNSMPVRIADFFGLRDREVEVWSNRGTSGIDGIVSTAVGHALACGDRLHNLIVGDLSFFYDRNGLWLNHEFPDNLRIIVLNDGGGGIFRVIDGPSAQGELMDLFVVPHTRTAELTAMEFGLTYKAVRSYCDLHIVFEEYKMGIVEIFCQHLV